MNTILSAAALLGIMASQPVWAGEGQGEPYAPNNPAVSTTMAMRRGGDTEYFRWTAVPTASQYAVKRGGDTEYFRWTTSPVPASQNRIAGAPTNGGHS